MKLHTIHTGNFMLDGGAMFGVVPKSIWNKTNPADANNMCNWAMRCLLIEDGDKLILIDNGIGDKQSEKFFKYYYLNGDDSLQKSLHQKGFDFKDITDVFMTHLHFDHCGGGVKWNKDKTKLELVFPNAKYWSNEKHWDWATQPNTREKASFLTENILPILESGQLHFIDENKSSPFPQFDIFFADGHTEKQMLPIVNYKGNKIAFVADLIPSVGHIPLVYVMGYDTRPLITLQEKKLFLTKAVEEQIIIYFEHDGVNESCTLKHSEKGVILDEIVQISDFS